VDSGEVEHTKTERNVLTKLSHPFLVKLHYSFQTPDKLYFVMDFINGGELFYHLQNERKFSNDRARFYCAEIVLALEYLHANGVMYRDLKPENLLIDSSGHIKLTDFGLSKEGISTDGRTSTFCGTPEYLAPEIVEGKQYTMSVDWWSLGTLLYEMLTGLPPFYDEDVNKMYQKKMNAALDIPDYVESKAKDLTKRFLDRNPATRLQDPHDIKSHSYFKDIDWEKLLQREVEPPYVPSITSKDSTKLIDKTFVNLDVNSEIQPSEVLPGDNFQGFTFVSGKQFKSRQENGENNNNDTVGNNAADAEGDGTVGSD